MATEFRSCKLLQPREKALIIGKATELGIINRGGNVLPANGAPTVRDLHAYIRKEFRFDVTDQEIRKVFDEYKTRLKKQRRGEEMRRYSRPNTLVLA